MKTFVRRLGLAVVFLLVGVGALMAGTRYYDGPISIIPGGPFRSGVVTPGPADWNFLATRDTVQFQTLTPPVSRTVWFVLHEGRLFLTSGAMRAPLASRMKQWPYDVTVDARIIDHQGSPDGAGEQLDVHEGCQSAV